MAGGDNRIFSLLCYAVCGGCEDYSTSGESRSGNTLGSIHDICSELLGKDYGCEILKNTNGHLCSTYPEKLIIPISDRRHCNVSHLKDYVLKGRFARTRGRFVVPVLLFKDKYICRSSTLARSPEMYCRRTYGYLMQGDAAAENPDISGNGQSDLAAEQQPQSNGVHSNNGTITRNALNSKEYEEKGGGNEWLLDEMRNADISLLQYLRVNTIFDLMVENKKVKFGMNVTSSEKVDRQQRYLKFHLLSVPYPGCEFFEEYRKQDYSAEGLMFDWTQAFVDADICVPKKILSLCDIEWRDYVNWDLVQLTKNYLLLHLRSLMDENSTGMLLHCISGWDRTPLFVSLMRLSLWADGLIHESLNAEEMVYFTVAYDWLLFHHRFSDRIANGEEIFYFCFDFLKYIYSDQFSMLSYSLIDESDGQSDTTETFVKVPHNETEDELERTNQCDVHGTVTNSFKSCVDGQQGNDDLDTLSSAITDENCVQLSARMISESDNLSSDDDPPLLDVTVLDSVTTIRNEPTECITMINSVSGNDEATEPTTEESAQQHKSQREEKLSYARKLVMESYQAAIRWQREREQANNSGIAATLFSHLSKTLNLGNR